MSFDAFKMKVDTLIKRVGGLSVRYSEDTDKGTFSAICSDGTEIIGSPRTLRVAVKFGTGHQAMATI